MGCQCCYIVIRMSTCDGVVTDFKVVVDGTALHVRITSNAVLVDNAYQVHLLGMNHKVDADEWIDVSRVMQQVNTMLCGNERHVGRTKLFDLLEAAALMTEPMLHDPARDVLIKATRRLNERGWMQLDVLQHSVSHKDAVGIRALTVIAARPPERKRKRKAAT
jgi:hypothetical protein